MAWFLHIFFLHCIYSQSPEDKSCFWWPLTSISVSIGPKYYGCTRNIQSGSPQLCQNDDLSARISFCRRGRNCMDPSRAGGEQLLFWCGQKTYIYINLFKKCLYKKCYKHAHCHNGAPSCLRTTVQVVCAESHLVHSRPLHFNPTSKIL